MGKRTDKLKARVELLDVAVQVLATTHGLYRDQAEQLAGSSVALTSQIAVAWRACGSASDPAICCEKMEALSRLGNEESVRLQEATDRLNDYATTLSDLLKNVGETVQGITNDLE